MFDVVQILSNTIKLDIQSGNCLVTKQCLIVFAHHTFPVWTGLKRGGYFHETFRTKHINKNQFWLIWLAHALLVRDIICYAHCD